VTTFFGGPEQLYEPCHRRDGACPCVRHPASLALLYGQGGDAVTSTTRCGQHRAGPDADARRIFRAGHRHVPGAADAAAAGDVFRAGKARTNTVTYGRHPGALVGGIAASCTPDGGRVMAHAPASHIRNDRPAHSPPPGSQSARLARSATTHPASRCGAPTSIDATPARPSSSRNWASKATCSTS